MAKATRRGVAVAAVGRLDARFHMIGANREEAVVGQFQDA